jgi:hypothetical protein
MAFYNEQAWSAQGPGRQASWEQPQPPSRSGTGHGGYTGGSTPSNLDLGASPTVNRDDGHAFASQFDGTSWRCGAV